MQGHVSMMTRIVHMIHGHATDLAIAPCFFKYDFVSIEK